MILDTETTGLPFSKNPKDLEKFSNARLIELGYIIYDQKGNKVKEYDSLVKSSGFSIKNTHIHGITDLDLILYGKPISEVYNIFYEDLLTVDLIIGHNIIFDINILLSEAYLNKYDTIYKYLEEKKTNCTMEMGKMFFNLDKNPRLKELFKMITNKDQIQDHRALSDCLMCSECYFKMIKFN